MRKPLKNRLIRIADVTPPREPTHPADALADFTREELDPFEPCSRFDEELANLECQMRDVICAHETARELSMALADDAAQSTRSDSEDGNAARFFALLDLLGIKVSGPH